MISVLAPFLFACKSEQFHIHMSVYNECISSLVYVSLLHRCHIVGVYFLCQRWHAKTVITYQGSIQHCQCHLANRRQTIRRHHELPRERPVSLCKGESSSVVSIFIREVHQKLYTNGTEFALFRTSPVAATDAGVDCV
jgi:hypothetical protein